MAWVQLRMPKTCYTARLEKAKFVFIRFKRTFVIQARPKRSCKGDFPRCANSMAGWLHDTPVRVFGTQGNRMKFLTAFLGPLKPAITAGERESKMSRVRFQPENKGRSGFMR